jgi:hypothetical protein
MSFLRLGRGIFFFLFVYPFSGDVGVRAMFHMLSTYVRREFPGLWEKIIWKTYGVVAKGNRETPNLP